MLHGGDIYGAAEKTEFHRKELLDFSANINPLGMPKEVKQALIESIEEIHHYPDACCRELKKAIAEREQLSDELIVCGNGAADLIFRIAYVLRPKKVLLTAPAFLEYEEALRQTGTETEQFLLAEEQGFRITENFLESITEETEAVFICNPNNPTGVLTSKKLLEKILERVAQTGGLLVMDECFLDFVWEEEQYSMKSFLKKSPNLIILKSFTKLFSIPGVRLGYALSDNRKLLKKMEAASQTWSVNLMAQKAGAAACTCSKFKEQTKLYVREEREFLKSRMERLLSPYSGKVFHSDANYLLLKIEKPRNLPELLLKKGIMIRSCANYAALSEHFYRAAVRTREENIRLLEALGEILSR